MVQTYSKDLEEISSITPGTSATSLGKAVSSSAGASDVGIAALGVRDDSLSTLAEADGEYTNVRTDAYGGIWVSLATLIAGEDQSNSVISVIEKPLSVSTYAPDLDTSTAAEASSVTKASPGVLYGFTFSNGNAAVRYIQFFNSTTVPADTTVPAMVFKCPANDTINVSIPMGRYFSTGISWSNSTTQNTKTIGAADSLADVRYK